jgi:hypothetical protein
MAANRHARDGMSHTINPAISSTCHTFNEQGF